MNGRSVVLVGVVGMSPAVLTETVWALAQEDPPLIPDEVVAITTLEGRTKIREQLFGKEGVWDALRTALDTGEDRLRFGSDASIQIVGDGNADYSDIATPEQNERCADFILQVLRHYSEDGNTQIIASIAGGRKTMSALMLACMNLLGREQDRVCHVLADDGFIFKTPNFFFPRSKKEARAANIQLSDIPFVRVRGWYEQESGKSPPSYSHMVSLYRQAAPPAVVEEKVVFDSHAKHLSIGGTEIPLSENEFDAVETFVRDRKSGAISSIQELLGDAGGIDADDAFRKYLSRARAKIKQAGFPELAARLLPSAKEKSYAYKNVHFKPRRPQTSAGS